jgi:hypothetical protein
MANVDIAGLLTGIPSLQDPMTQGRINAANLPANASAISRTLARYQPENEARMRQAVGGLMSTLTGQDFDIRTQGAKDREAIGQLDPNSPEYQAQLLTQLAKVDPMRAAALKFSFDQQAAERAEKQLAKSYQSDADEYFLDQDNNPYLVSSTFNPNPNATNRRSVDVMPFGNSPEEPVGQLRPLPKGLTLAEYQARQQALTTEKKIRGIDETEQLKLRGFDASEQDVLKASKKDFNKIRLDQAALRNGMLYEEKMLEDTLALAEATPQGGPINNISKRLTDYLGETPKDVAELEYALADRVLSDLKNKFGGLISEGEREYLLKINPTVQRGAAANKALLERLLQIQKSSLERNNMWINSATFDEYLEKTKAYEVRLGKDRFKDLDPMTGISVDLSAKDFKDYEESLRQ